MSWPWKLVKLDQESNFILSKWKNIEQNAGKVKMLKKQKRWKNKNAEKAKAKVELVYKWKKVFEKQKKNNGKEMLQWNIAVKWDIKWVENEEIENEWESIYTRNFSTLAMEFILIWTPLVKFVPAGKLHIQNCWTFPKCQ